VTSVSVRTLTEREADWASAVLEDAWGSVSVARKGEVLDASSLPGFVARVDRNPVGLAVVAARGKEYEIVSISTTLEGHGVGRALLQRCVDDARRLGCHRVWLTTTNNNVRSFAFYQRFGMDLCAFYRHGVELSRRVKPSIPLRDEFGVAIAHELEFELIISNQQPAPSGGPIPTPDGR
jgi:RimJ/RimL family protein N-acetyltransferase